MLKIRDPNAGCSLVQAAPWVSLFLQILLIKVKKKKAVQSRLPQMIQYPSFSSNPCFLSLTVAPDHILEVSPVTLPEESRAACVGKCQCISNLVLNACLVSSNNFRSVSEASLPFP